MCANTCDINTCAFIFLSFSITGKPTLFARAVCGQVQWMGASHHSLDDLGSNSPARWCSPAVNYQLLIGFFVLLLLYKGSRLDFHPNILLLSNNCFVFRFNELIKRKLRAPPEKVGTILRNCLPFTTSFFTSETML
jgi:hypothetical protein